MSFDCKQLYPHILNKMSSVTQVKFFKYQHFEGAKIIFYSEFNHDVLLITARIMLLTCKYIMKMSSMFTFLINLKLINKMKR